MVEKKIIETNQVIEQVFNSPGFSYLREHILDSEEISLIHGNPVINYVNNKNFNKNLYTDLRKDSSLKWLGIYDNNRLMGLQLICFAENHIELIIVEKNSSIHSLVHIFPEVISYCKQFDLPIITFPENDKLSEYYQKFGFRKISQGYLKLV